MREEVEPSPKRGAAVKPAEPRTVEGEGWTSAQRKAASLGPTQASAKRPDGAGAKWSARGRDRERRSVQVVRRLRAKPAKLTGLCPRSKATGNREHPPRMRVALAATNAPAPGGHRRKGGKSAWLLSV